METYLIPIIAALMALGLVGGFTVGAIWGRRSASDRDKSGEKPQATTANAGAPPSVMAVFDDTMELPAALIGARCNEILEHFAPLMGVTPVTLLRAATALSRAADWADSVAAQRAPAGDAQQPPPTKKEGKVLPFSKRKAPRAAEPIEDLPSGRYERIKTLADVIRLTAHALPTDSPEATVRALASLFREDPYADMDTDSGPMWIETIKQFLTGNPRATLAEVNAEYNRRAKEHNRLLDEEETRVLAGAPNGTDAPLTPTQVSPVTTHLPKTDKS